MSESISFRELKQTVTLEQVLGRYNLLDSLTLRGKSHRGVCPFCGGEEDFPFSASLEKNCFRCFLCNASGNIIDFVAKKENVGIPEAGRILAEAFEIGGRPVTTKPHDNGNTAESTSSLHKEEAPVGQGSDVVESSQETEKDSSNGTVVTSGNDGTPRQAPESGDDATTSTEPNLPLSFALKNIDPAHPALAALGITEDTAKEFEAGYYSGKGMFRDHVVIPIHNYPDRALVAYAGLRPNQVGHQYPPKFNRHLEVFNLARAARSERLVWEEGFIVVLDPLDVLVLYQAGYDNAVALMRYHSGITGKQMKLLSDALGEGGKLTLLLPWEQSDIVPSLISALIGSFFVHLIRYHSDPESPGLTVDTVEACLS